MKNIVFFSLAACLVFYGCKKKVPTDEQPREDVEMRRISQHTWEVYRVMVSGTDVWNIPQIIKECQKDDTYRFYRDSVLTHYENTDICSGGTDSARNSWRFIEGRRKIIATLLNMTDTGEIISLDETEMQLGVTLMDNPSVVYFRKK